MGTSSHLCRARAVHVGVSPEWGALSARPRADAARVAASFWPSPAVSYSRTIRAMFGTACLSRSSRFAISSSLAGSPARTPRDGWNHRYQACRRNPTHDPCWHSAALPAAPAGGSRAARGGFRPAHPSEISESASIPGEPLPPSMQPKVSRISQRADSTALGGKSAYPMRQTCWAKDQAASSVIIFSHRLRCSDITCSRVIHATETAIGDRGLGLLTIMR